jgi:hypothetical protein
MNTKFLHLTIEVALWTSVAGWYVIRYFSKNNSKYTAYVNTFFEQSCNHATSRTTGMQIKSPFTYPVYVCL